MKCRGLVMRHVCRVRRVAVAIGAGVLIQAGALLADTNITSDVTLTQDESWGNVTIASGVNVNLNGHKLTVTGLAGEGTITPYRFINDGTEYRILEYVESTGKQYIDSGVNPCKGYSDSYKTTMITGRVAITTSDTYHSIIGNAWRYSSTCYVGVLMRGDDETFGLAYGKAPFTYADNNSIEINTAYDFVTTWNYSDSSETLTMNGITVSRDNGSNWGIEATMYIFARSINAEAGSTECSADTFAHAKLYSLQIYRPYDATSPVRDYVPVLRVSDGVAGLYDRVNGTFSPSASETALVAGPESADGSELHVDVAEGETVTNDSVALVGALKFVKEGDGVFVGGKAQEYCGGTLVSAGTVQPPDGSGGNTTYCYDKHKAFGTNATIVVSSGGTFDLRANYAYRSWITLAGGTLTNTKTDMTKSTWGGSGIGLLTADSNLNVPYDTVFGDSSSTYGGDMDLGGFTLTTAIADGKTLYMRCGNIVNGTVDITSGGTLYTVNECDARTAEFKVNCALDIEAALSVSNYVATYSTDSNAGDEVINVYGTFTPGSTHNYFHACNMMSNSTINLSGRTTALPLVSSFTNGGNTLAFADNAVVHLDIGERTPHNGSARLISWSEAPSNIDTITFTCSNALYDGKLVVNANGVRLPCGLVIIMH